METISIEKYEEILQKIEKALPNLDTNAAEEALQTLFEIKPVRLKWYLIKAQLMLKEGEEPDKISAFLADKCDPCYAYEDVNDYFELMAALAECRGDHAESSRYLFQKGKMNGNVNANSMDNIRKSLCRVIENGRFNSEAAEKLCEDYYITGNIYISLLWQTVWNRIKQRDEIKHDWIVSEHNAEYYYNRLTEKISSVFVLLESADKEQQDIYFAARALLFLGKKVYVIRNPKKNAAICNVKDALSCSTAQMAETDGINFIPSYFCDETNENDNRGELLEYIAGTKTANDLITVLGSGLQIDQLIMQKKWKAQLERLTEANTEYMEDNIAIARFGNYLSYIANIYELSKDQVEELLYRKPSYDFSIIIPCRNDGNTLFYTLQTCLNQDYTGKYEIVVSDNADREWGEDTPCARICNEIKDDRIHYYRTPANLSLPKNFEYAFLNAKGAFLISMGADDGILPWALSRISNILHTLPEQKVLLWNEATYRWPGMDKGLHIGKDNSFLSIPEDNLPNESVMMQYQTEDVFWQSFDTYGMMYLMPQLYHNSGIRREYMSEIFEKTGVLWAGISQDICMAVTVGNIEKGLYMTEDILTITGISKSSIGANWRQSNTDFEQEDIIKKYRSTCTQGIRAMSFIERLIPGNCMNGDLSGMYACILYACAQGIIPEEKISRFDWKKMFGHVAEELDKSSLKYDLSMHRLNYSASLLGEEFHTWFAENLYDLNPIIEKKNSEAEKTATMENDIFVVTGKCNVIENHQIDNVFQVTKFLQNFLLQKM